MNDVISNTFERHAQTALVLLLVALLVWVGKTTQETSVAIAQLSVKVGYLQAQAETPHSHAEIIREMSKLRDEVGSLRQCNGGSAK